MKNGERADRLLREAREVAAEMKQALGHDSWNLATRRAQEALELTLKALLSEMGIRSWPGSEARSFTRKPS